MIAQCFPSKYAVQSAPGDMSETARLGFVFGVLGHVFQISPGFSGIFKDCII
jgi:hypothetical protein